MDKVYEALPLTGPADIRVVEVLPRKPGDVIETRLRVASLDDHGVQYQALSYTWGDPTDKRAIRCNGEGFWATKSMYSALERLPTLHLSQKLQQVYWIDAICIDQQNWAERGSQVKLMLRIYRQAEMVWADLGDASSEEFLGVAKFINLMLDLLDINNGGRLGQDINQDEIPRAEDPIWIVWQNFLARPYFARLWTVQEFALAKQLFYVYGSSVIDWRVPYTITSSMDGVGLGESQRNIPPSGSFSLAQAAIRGAQGAFRLHLCRDQILSNGEGRSLPAMLRISRRCLATDPKDRIFGILGMIRDFDLDQPGMAVSYDPKESVAEVYMRVARCLVQAGPGFLIDLLHDSGAVNEGRNPDLPSWIPDWQWRRATQPFLNRNDDPNGAFAANSLPVSATLSENGRILTVRAALIDVIERKTSAYGHDIGKDHTNTEVWLQRHRWMMEVIKLHKEVSAPGYVNSIEEKVDALWRTLVTNTTYYARIEAPPVYRDGFLHALRRMELIEETLATMGPDEELSVDRILGPNPSPERISAWQTSVNLSTAFRTSTDDAILWRSFLLTKSGYYGLAHGSVEVGDSIVLIAGTDAPFVMRRHCKDDDDEDDGMWTIICECYVHGYMKGEACETANWQNMNIA